MQPDSDQNPAVICPTCGLQLEPEGFCLRCTLDPPEVRVEPKKQSRQIRYFGYYELIEEIGQDGAMGIVWRARQLTTDRLETDRFVALKMLKPERLYSAEVVDRFHQEVQAAASLDHPHILKIYEVGKHEDHHFYTMRLAEGGSLARQITDGRWDPPKQPAQNARRQQREIAALISKVARGIQHAHERGVLHRDLKPGNILLDLDGTPYVSDFGLAKLLRGGSDLTRTQGMLGTPAYMAPEQAARGGRDVTARSDVWALGVILYQLLTGRLPFEEADPLALLHQIQTVEPTNPQILNSVIDLDLATLTLACLEKIPKQRCASASELADELDRWIAGEPIHARPVNLAERGWKWVQRNPAVAASVGVLAFLITGWLVRELVGAAQTREENRRLSLVNADVALSQGRTPEGLATLAGILSADPADTTAANRASSAIAYRPWSVRLKELSRSTNGINAVELSPDRKWWVSANAGGRIEFFPRQTNEPSQRIDTGLFLTRASFSPESETLVVSGTNNTVGIVRLNADHTWRLASNYALPRPVTWLQTLSSNRVLVGDANGNLTLRSLMGSAAPWATKVGEYPITAGAVSENGERVAVGDFNGDASVVRTSDGRLLNQASGINGAGLLRAIAAIRFAPDTESVLIAPDNPEVREWRWRETQSPVVRRMPSPIRRLDLLPDGDWLAGSEDGRMFSIPRTGTGRRSVDLGVQFGGPIMKLICSGGIVACLNVSGEVNLLDWTNLTPLIEPIRLPPNSQAFALDHGSGELVTASLDKKVTLWSWNQNQDSESGVAHRRPAATNVNCVAISDDGRWLASGADDGLVVLLRTPTGWQQQPLRFPAPVQSLAFPNNPQRLVVGSYSSRSAIVSLDSAIQTLTPFGPPDGLWEFKVVDRLSLVATRGLQPAAAQLWNLTSGRFIATMTIADGDAVNDIERIAVAPQGSAVVAINVSQLFWWDASRPTNHARVIDLGDQPQCCALDTLGETALVGTVGGHLQWWTQGSDRRLDDQTLLPVKAVVWSPGRAIAFAGLTDGSVYQVAAHRPNQLVGRLRGEITDLAVSPDGQLLAASTTTGQLKVWQAADHLPVSELLPHPERVDRITFGPDSSTLLAVCNDGTTREYRVRWPMQKDRRDQLQPVGGAASGTPR